jgi:hypothetical protein
MHFVVAAIPFFFHLSLFLFLTGLWLRLQDMNEHLGLIVGVPSLVIALSYVVVTLLPIFTDAPFFTSVSEVAQPIVDKIRHIAKHNRTSHPHRTFSLIPSSYPVLILIVTGGFGLIVLAPATGLPDLGVTIWIICCIGLGCTQCTPGASEILGILRFPGISWIQAGGSTWTLISLRISSYLPRVRTHHLTALPILIGWVVSGCIRALWKFITLPLPTFRLDQNPFDELNKLKVRRSDRGRGTHLRALAWLLNTKTPLNKDEVKEILREFSDQRNAGEHLDHTNIRLFVLSLSSFLEDDHISDGEQPIFNYCTTILAEGMDQAFGDGGYNQRTLFQNTNISKKLSPHFHLATPNKGSSDGHSPASQEEGYWARAIPAL